MKRLLPAAAMAAAAATTPLSADSLPLIPRPVSVSRNDGTCEELAEYLKRIVAGLD